jgi:hypothetical protein
MPERYLQFIPFLAMTGRGASVDVPEIIKGVVVAGVIGLVVLYGGVQAFGPELAGMRRELLRIEKTNNDRLDSLSDEIKQIRRDFYVPRGRQ